MFPIFPAAKVYIIFPSIHYFWYLVNIYVCELPDTDYSDFFLLLTAASRFLCYLFNEVLLAKFL